MLGQSLWLCGCVAQLDSSRASWGQNVGLAPCWGPPLSSVATDYHPVLGESQRRLSTVPGGSPQPFWVVPGKWCPSAQPQPLYTRMSSKGEFQELSNPLHPMTLGTSALCWMLSTGPCGPVPPRLTSTDRIPGPLPLASGWVWPADSARIRPKGQLFFRCLYRQMGTVFIKLVKYEHLSVGRSMNHEHNTQNVTSRVSGIIF